MIVLSLSSPIVLRKSLIKYQVWRELQKQISFLSENINTKKWDLFLQCGTDVNGFVLEATPWDNWLNLPIYIKPGGNFLGDFHKAVSSPSGTLSILGKKLPGMVLRWD